MVLEREALVARLQALATEHEECVNRALRLRGQVLELNYILNLALASGNGTALAVEENSNGGPERI